MKIFRPAFLYFLLVFGIGFVLGTIRTLWLVPQIGARTAELMEMPVMLMTIFFVARRIVQCFVQLAPSHWLAAGFLALVILLVTEFTFVLALRDITLSEYLEQRDPVSGTAYAASLILFACAPFLITKMQRYAAETG